MRVVQLNKVMDQLFTLHKTGNDPGVSTGFKKLDPLYTIRRGNTTLVTGYPTSGKSQITFQFQCNLSSVQGWRNVIYSPETGSPEEVYAEIIHCLTGKTFNKDFPNYITEAEIYKVAPFVHDYFKVIDPTDEGMSIEAYYEAVREIISEHMIHTISIDNWNDLEHDMQPFGNKISEYLKYQLPRFNRFCKTENVHGFLLVHPRNPDSKTGEIPPAPRPDMIEGGSLWYAKAQSILIVHRDWSDNNNRTTDLIIAKAKPKIIGRKGVTTLEFSPKWNCYFENEGFGDVYPESPFKIDGKPELSYEQKLSGQISTAPF